MKEEKLIDNIKTYGVHHNNGEKRRKILFEDIGLPVDQKAEYVLVSGCLIHEDMPQVFSALKEFLEHFNVDYTFLSKEFCCGWLPLLQPAVMAKDEEKVSEMKKIAGGFIQKNIKQAEELGAKAIVTICSACEPNYMNFKDTNSLEILHYPQLLDRYFKEGKLDLEADYYLGCYRFRRMITPIALDIDSIEEVLGKIDKLKLNYIDNKLCCFVPKHMEDILNNIKTNIVITTCTGCSANLQRKLEEKGNCKVKMLPEIVWQAVKG